MFGPFEVMDLTESLNWTSIITLNHKETASDLADLVSYCFAEEGQEAKQRSEDGHTAPYNLNKYFELGNEIDNENFVAQV